MSTDPNANSNPNVPAEAKQKSPWQKYIDSLGDKYVERLITLAKKQEYTIMLKKPTGETIKHPITGEQEPKYDGWESMTYKRSKVSQKDWNILEKLRGKYNTYRDSKDASEEKVAEMLAQIYEMCAYCFLGMSHDEFIRADWEEMKPILDACNFRTVNSLPNSAEDFISSSTKDQPL